MLTTALFLALSQTGATIHPIPAGPTPVTNPLKGYAPYDSGEGRHFGEATMAFHETSWRRLEAKEGMYSFDEWVKKDWNYPFSKDKHIILRVFSDYPTQGVGIPKWLVDQGVKTFPYTDFGGGRCPDYKDPRLQKAMLKLITALGKRFDSDPRVAFVQLGFLGFWGEWHTWPHTEWFAPLDFQKKVVDTSRAAFPHKKIMMRTATNYAATLPTMGYFDDMIPSDTDNGDEFDFFTQIRAAGRTENWKVAPLGGEMVPGAAKQYLGKDWGMTTKAVDTAHFSWIGPYCPASIEGDATYQLKRDELSRKLGYDFQLTSASFPDTAQPGQTISVTITGSNNGVAPFYYPWRVALALIDSRDKRVKTYWTKEDIRTWLPGTFSFTTQMVLPQTSGEFRVALGVEDPWTKRMSMRFSNAVKVVEGFATVGVLKLSR